MFLIHSVLKWPKNVSFDKTKNIFNLLILDKKRKFESKHKCMNNDTFWPIFKHCVLPLSLQAAEWWKDQRSVLLGRSQEKPLDLSYHFLPSLEGHY